MKQTVLGQPSELYKKAFDGKIRLCVAVAVLTLVLHIILICIRTEQNHNLLLWCNIGCDVLCGFFLIYQIWAHILPCRRLYALYTRPKQLIEATVSGISAVCVRYMDMDCYEVTADGRRLFVPMHTVALQVGENYRLSVVSNIIVEAAQ